MYPPHRERSCSVARTGCLNVVPTRMRSPDLRILEHFASSLVNLMLRLESFGPERRSQMNDPEPIERRS